MEKVLELKHITKRFGKVTANNNVDFTLYKGEILSVLGENGSGKTSLMNVIAGIYTPDEGEYFVNGELVTVSSPSDAFKYHIGMVHQHFKLVDLFTGTDNILLGESRKSYSIKKAYKKLSVKKAEEIENKKGFKRLLTHIKYFFKHIRPIINKIGASIGYLYKERGQTTREIAERYGFKTDLNKKVYQMSVSEKQTVEILKVLYRGADILILDEPTAVLTPQEIETLFDILRKMRDDGKSIIIITHKLNEVLSISDRVTVLRKGENIGTVNTKDTNIMELTEMMVGKKVTLDIHRDEPVNSKPRLCIENLTVKKVDGTLAVNNVSFTANSGEILGIAGIAGSGQKELLEAITGLGNVVSGDVILVNPKENKPTSFFHKTLKDVRKLAEEGAFHTLDGEPVISSNYTNKQLKEAVNAGNILFNEDEIINLKHKNPLEIRELGVHLSFVPEDRLGMGLVADMDITDNMMLRSYQKGHSILLNRNKPKVLAEEIIDELEVVTPGTNVPVSHLSGGNIQKILVGREIAYTPKVLMAAYPVRGLDINSSYLIYDLLNEQKKKGVAVIFVGEDLDVLIGLCDRIAVICGGEISGIVDARQATKQQIGELMTSKYVEEANNSYGE